MVLGMLSVPTCAKELALAEFALQVHRCERPTGMRAVRLVIRVLLQTILELGPHDLGQVRIWR